MRIAMIIALIVPALSTATWGQTRTTASSEHFEGWPSEARWGADKQTFDVRFGFRHVEATFTVAQNGFGWHHTFTGMKPTFNTWADVTAWCLAPGTVLLRTRDNRSTRWGLYELEPDVLATIVDGYFRKYAPQAEWTGPEWKCTSAALSGPPPSDLSKVRELLEAASSEKR